MASITLKIKIGGTPTRARVAELGTLGRIVTIQRKIEDLCGRECRKWDRSCGRRSYNQCQSCVWRNCKFNRTQGRPPGRPYPPYSPRKTRGTRVYPRLCGEELESQSYLTPPPHGVPIHRAASAGPEELGCIRRCVRRNCKINHTRPPHGASLSTEQRTQDRDSGVSAVVWRGAGDRIVRGTPTGRTYPPNGPHWNGTEGLGCSRLSVGRS